MLNRFPYLCVFPPIVRALQSSGKTTPTTGVMDKTLWQCLVSLSVLTEMSRDQTRGSKIHFTFLEWVRGQLQAHGLLLSSHGGPVSRHVDNSCIGGPLTCYLVTRATEGIDMLLAGNLNIELWVSKKDFQKKLTTMEARIKIHVTFLLSESLILI